jgi:large subunit ribosomal protein L15
MQMHDLKPADGARHRRRRVGRGPGSGLGKTCGRGHKGQRSRAGASKHAWFEGGQMPLFRRLPKRGFKSVSRTSYSTVNVYELERFEDGATVTPEDLLANRVVRSLSLPVKILADGEIKKALTVHAHQFSQAAIVKIRAAGGEVEVLE